MVRQCVVCKKLDNSKPGLIFRRFPINPERRQRWLSLLDLENQHVIKYAKICSDHFDQSDIMVTQITGRRQIRPEAEPQIRTNVFAEPLSFSSDSTVSSPKKSFRTPDIDFESMFHNPQCPDLPEVTAEEINAGPSAGPSNLILPIAKQDELKPLSPSTETTETASETEVVINRIAKCSATIKNMSMQLQSTSTVLSVSLEKTESLTVIKKEPFESEIGIDDIPNSLDEVIIPDIKNIDIVSHGLSDNLIKSETVSENMLENNHSGSVETQVFVKTENFPYIKTEDTSDGNVSSSTNQGVIEVQDFSDFTIRSRKAKHPDKTDFSECYKTVATTSCEKDKKKGNVFEVPVIPYCREKCTFINENHSHFKQHKLSHKTKAEVDDRYLKYRCDKCKYKTCWPANFKRHKLMHLKPEQIPYFYCYHCPCKCKVKRDLKIHIFNHFKKEEVPFHCYICDFTTLKRDLIIEHFKKHPKHHSKCDETDYDTLYRCDKCIYTTCYISNLKRHKVMHLKPEQIPYFYCYHCPRKCKRKNSLKMHIFNHFKNEEVSFYCYICDFTTLKRNLIIEHFKKHPKHHSKCDEIDYKNQLETYNKKQMRYCCEKCTYTSGKSSDFKFHQLTHKTKAKIDHRLLKYRCDKCKYKTCWLTSLKGHKLTHLKPEEIHYFYCYHCSYKSKWKHTLKRHMFSHFKKEEIPFHCYICDFVTLKRKYFKKHLKHHNKCDETEKKSTS